MKDISKAFFTQFKLFFGQLQVSFMFCLTNLMQLKITATGGNASDCGRTNQALQNSKSTPILTSEDR